MSANVHLSLCTSVLFHTRSSSPVTLYTCLSPHPFVLTCHPQHLSFSTPVRPYLSPSTPVVLHTRSSSPVTLNTCPTSAVPLLLSISEEIRSKLVSTPLDNDSEVDVCRHQPAEPPQRRKGKKMARNFIMSGIMNLGEVPYLYKITSDTHQDSPLMDETAGGQEEGKDERGGGSTTPSSVSGAITLPGTNNPGHLYYPSLAINLSSPAVGGQAQIIYTGEGKISTDKAVDNLTPPELCYHAAKSVWVLHGLSYHAVLTAQVSRGLGNEQESLGVGECLQKKGLERIGLGQRRDVRTKAEVVDARIEAAIRLKEKETRMRENLTRNRGSGGKKCKRKGIETQEQEEENTKKEEF
ncbi:hypothetical protein Pmani_039035 [Petrolisthes manimaculis]|uniref:Uncharacterized protein n=1 Tax=Petrolisthes manimaculis TaxID=1843537 RepID=A0AAE1NDH8_9EUCA|nr:hypothetical protein Pmani_039035 [Petrolisthes manimaculis]